MAVTYDKRNKCFRFQFNRVISGRRCRHSKLLPRGWTQAQADAFDRQESAKLYAVATGVQRRDPIITEAVTLYLEDKKGRLKSYKQTSEHLSAIAWAFDGKPMSELPLVAKAIRDWSIEPGKQLAPATIKNRLACLKSACRWAWKKHGLTEHDPTTRMLMPEVNNERHSYKGRREMLMAARACTNWYGQIAIRVGFYSGMRLGEQMRATVEGNAFVLQDKDTKNGDRRSIPIHPKIKHLAKFYPLPGPKITMQRAWERARDAVGLQGSTFHDLRHWAASEMVNNGVDLYTVGAILGHRDARSTKRYSHLNTKTLAKAVEKIGKKDE
jgi:integrase